MDANGIIEKLATEICKFRCDASDTPRAVKYVLEQSGLEDVLAACVEATKPFPHDGASDLLCETYAKLTAWAERKG